MWLIIGIYTFNMQAIRVTPYIQTNRGAARAKPKNLVRSKAYGALHKETEAEVEHVEREMKNILSKYVEWVNRHTNILTY